MHYGGCSGENKLIVAPKMKVKEELVGVNQKETKSEGTEQSPRNPQEGWSVLSASRFHLPGREITATGRSPRFYGKVKRLSFSWG